MSFTIKLSKFEGPFDLLLFFIERDEIDIYDIPISEITEHFLDYLRVLDSLNMDVASEFILVAATLMRIKAKMLLPRKALDEEGKEIDPREELVQKIVEYKQFKEVSEKLEDLEANRAARNIRGNTTEELKKIANRTLVDVELETLTLFKLLRTFQQVIQRYEMANRVAIHTVEQYTYTLEGQRYYVLTQVQHCQELSFQVLFAPCSTRLHAIFTFLAILELVQLGQLKLSLKEGINNFNIDALASPDAP